MLKGFPNLSTPSTVIFGGADADLFHPKFCCAFDQFRIIARESDMRMFLVVPFDTKRYLLKKQVLGGQRIA